MSAFGIGTNTQTMDSGEIRGRMYHIACKTWFTSTCSPRPLSFKFEGDDGVLQTVKNINIKCSEDKNYAGIASKEYVCSAIIGGLNRDFKLIFYLEACKWVMIVQE